MFDDFTLDQLRELQTQWKVKQRESSKVIARIAKEIKRRNRDAKTTTARSATT